LAKNSILTDLVDKLVEEKVPGILCKAIELLANLMQGEEGIPKALKTEVISRLMNILDLSNPQVFFYKDCIDSIQYPENSC
jgi:hypothetical protein